MKHQQISVDFINMVFSTWSYLALAATFWILLRLVQACFYLPQQLKKQTNMQRMLQDKVREYFCEISENS
ncbi:hypothetical protein WN55_07010 [Dufourea novaeangliae]|uniref:Uncharacterized protein n=1 Tax=Dufourea novaeangliae TaxID=178035 RepID=A0A154PR59_DUFNO|nr:hypothetical protein WN55_07010 [Dufourea novaeangliae]